MNKKYISILAGALIIWIASLYVVYDTTREKWLALGSDSGEIHGKGLVMQELCNFATTDEPESPVVWGLSVKAERIEMSGENGTYSFKCD
ncbi:MAG: hypothetical protein V3U96_10450 [Paracoccaceae bacterium]